MPIGTPVGNLDIANATLRTSNLETQNIKIGSIFVNPYLGLETTANVGNCPDFVEVVLLQFRRPSFQVQRTCPPVS